VFSRRIERREGKVLFLSASEHVEEARHELRLLSREESAHAACMLPVKPLSEPLMHVDAQLGYPPPLGGPWPRAGAAAEARSVANCMLRMLMYRADGRCSL
jgi:hypothetical protein